MDALMPYPNWPLISLASPVSWGLGALSLIEHRQLSTLCVFGASYQVMYMAFLVVQCLNDLRGPNWLRLLVLLQGCPSPQLLSVFPNSTTGVCCFCLLVGCKYLHPTLSAACWVFWRAVMIDPFWWVLHSFSNNVRPWDLPFIGRETGY